MAKLTYEEYLREIAEGAATPLTYGLYLACSGNKPMPEEMEAYLKDCYNKNLTPAQTIESWM